MCQWPGCDQPGARADHIVERKDDQSLRLSLANSQFLCARHHGLKTHAERRVRGSYHPQWLRPAIIPFTIVCGAPRSGKSTWIRERAAPEDLVIDLDAIRVAQAGRPMWSLGYEGLDDALRQRNALLGRITRSGCKWPRAWMQVLESQPERRQWWADTMRPTSIVVMSTSEEVCLARARLDRVSLPWIAEQEAAISRWFASYRPRAGDTVIKNPRSA